MTRFRTYVLIVAFVCIPPSLLSAQSSDPGRLLAPCLAADTAVVVRIDLAHMDLDALTSMVLTSAADNMNADQIAQLRVALERVRRPWQQRIDQFKEAGGESLFLVYAPSDMLLVVPRTARVEESAMKTWFEGLDRWPMASVREDGLLIAARPWVLERYRDRPGVSRPELSQAAAKATGATIEVFLFPSVDSRRVLEAMLPSLLGPSLEFGDGTFTRGLQWATISIDFTATPSFQAYAESADAGAAAALQGFITKALRLVDQIPVLAKAYPNVKASTSLLAPQVDGHSLRLRLDENQSKRLTGDLIAPGLFEMHKSFVRARCGAVLSGMGKALLIYANDHGDQWPPNLELLVDTVEYPRTDLTCPAMRDHPNYQSYIYRGADTGGTSVEPMIIMVHDRAGNHEGGRYVLFVDSHVEWVTEDQFQTLVAGDNELRRKRALAEKPAQ